MDGWISLQSRTLNGTDGMPGTRTRPPVSSSHDPWESPGISLRRKRGFFFPLIFSSPSPRSREKSFLFLSSFSFILSRLLLVPHYRTYLPFLSI